ncbi:Nucleic acid-binding, OB-fold [Sesbania bispinosa]|nr:Nucleic acid-binding, OB-fold [Sesbania bispinosa]
MADFPSVVHHIREINMSSVAWNLKVKVLRIWNLPDANTLADFSCVEMLLIDGEGTRIEACLPSHVLKNYRVEILEERLYRFKNFSVVPNTGPYKTTDHKYKLFFVKDTKIAIAEPFFIPVSTLNVISAEELLRKTDEIDYMFAEQNLYKFGAFKRYICMELMDHTAKMECVLYDEYVDVIQNYLKVHGRLRTIIVLQFVKLSPVGGLSFGDTVVQNMFSATRVLFNPLLAEVVDFRKRITPTVSMNDDFLVLHPPKKISDLKAFSETFMCIIWAKVVRVLSDSRWWYLECKCKKPVVPRDGIYHCEYCSRNVVNVTPRQVEDYDFHDSAYLTLDDSDVQKILKKTCKELLDEVEDPLSRQTPQLVRTLVGKQMLFKVLKLASSDGWGDDIFKVDRICDDYDIVGSFFKGDALLLPQKIRLQDGMVEYKFLPLVRNYKLVKLVGTSRACPINVENQALCVAESSGHGTKVNLRRVTRKLESEFKAESSSGKALKMDHCVD